MHPRFLPKPTKPKGTDISVLADDGSSSVGECWETDIAGQFFGFGENKGKPTRFHPVWETLLK